MTDFTVIIPYRDRRKDWRRQANLDSAVCWWREQGCIEPIIVDDGRRGSAQFNRSAAMNRGAALADTDIIVFSEADLLVPFDQILEGVKLAAEKPGLVVPFSRFMAMTEVDTNLVRERTLHPADAEADQVRGDCQSIGAVNIVSRESIAAIGQFDEQFDGHAYDDDATEYAFRTCCGPTRFVEGPGWHQHHMPGAFYATPASTEADLAATERNRCRWRIYQRANTPEKIRRLTAGGQ